MGPYLKCLTTEQATPYCKKFMKGCVKTTPNDDPYLIESPLNWPTMKHDSKQYVRKCEKCQKFANVIHTPVRELNPISSLWPFSMQGINIVGPLPTTPSQKKFLLVVTDYFTKWVETEAYAQIIVSDLIKFMWKNMSCHFGILKAIVSDNGHQLAKEAF